MDGDKNTMTWKSIMILNIHETEIENSGSKQGRNRVEMVEMVEMVEIEEVKKWSKQPKLNKK